MLQAGTHKIFTGFLFSYEIFIYLLTKFYYIGDTLLEVAQGTMRFPFKCLVRGVQRMNDTSRNAQDAASKAEEASQPTNNAANGGKPADPSTTAEPKAGEGTLEMELSAAQAKANEYLDGWQRARAD